MKTKIFILAFICLFLTSCDWFAAKVAELVLDGSWQETYTSYDSPQFEGYVKNIGNGTAYNASIDITCYSDVGKTTIIATVTGYPADLGDIPPNTKAYFDAICFSVDSHDDIKATSYTIDWLDRE